MDGRGAGSCAAPRPLGRKIPEAAGVAGPASRVIAVVFRITPTSATVAHLPGRVKMALVTTSARYFRRQSRFSEARRKRQGRPNSPALFPRAAGLLCGPVLRRAGAAVEVSSTPVPQQTHDPDRFSGAPHSRVLARPAAPEAGAPENYGVVTYFPRHDLPHHSASRYHTEQTGITFLP